MASSTEAATVSINHQFDNSSDEINSGQRFSYILQYNCFSITEHCEEVTITTTLDNDLFLDPTKVKVSGSSHMTRYTFNDSTGEMTFYFEQELPEPSQNGATGIPAGSTGEIKIEVEFPNGTTLDGTNADFQSTITSSNSGSDQTDEITMEAQARNKMRANKRVLSGDRSSTLDLPITYAIELCNQSNPNGGLNASDIVFTDYLPENTVFVSASGSGDYDSSEHKVTWDPQIFTAYASSCLTETVTIIYPSSEFDIGETTTNSVEIEGESLGGSNFNDSASTTHILAEPETSAGVIKTTLPDSQAYIGEDLRYYFNIENTGNTPIENFELVDEIPSNLKVKEIYLGNHHWRNPEVRVRLQYQKNNTSNWLTDQTYTIEARETVKVDVDDLIASNEYISAIRWQFLDDLPVGFTSGDEDTDYIKSGYLAEVLEIDNEGSIVQIGDEIENTVTATAEDIDSIESSTSHQILASSTKPILTKQEINGITEATPGDELEFSLILQLDENSKEPLINPSIGDLIDSNFEYIEDSWQMIDNTASADAPAPSFNIINNFNGDKSLLTWSWDNYQYSDLEANSSIVITFRVRVKENTPVSNIENFGYILNWDNDEVSVTGSNQIVNDSNDLNSNNSTNDKIVSTTNPYEIEIGSLAALDSVKWVKGTLDPDWHRYPDSGLTEQGKDFNYRMSITNIGNIPVDEIIIIDILPYLGDNGVIDPQDRLTEWLPYLSGPVITDIPSTVYYSTTNNPCRDELKQPGDDSPWPTGCTPANWNTSIPADITTVKSIKFDFGSYIIQPGESLEISWPMFAPLDSPTDGEITWNSFGYAANRADENTALLPTEPIKVGVEVVPVPPPIISGFTWVDENNNGQKEATEEGKNQVYVVLKEKNSNNIVQVTQTNSNSAGENGYYQFSGFPPGEYFVEFIEVPNHTISTPSQIEVTITNDEIIDNISAGYVPEDTSAVGGRIWEDTNEDGIRNENESSGVNGLTVELYNQNDELIATTVTRTNEAGIPGIYTFEGLDSGDYYIQVIPPSDAYTFTERGETGQKDSYDSDTNFAGIIEQFNLESGEFDNTWDGGVIIEVVVAQPNPPSSGGGSSRNRTPDSPTILTGTVYDDINDNGVKDEGESYISYSDVTVVTETGVIYDTITDESGRFTITGIDSGISSVTVSHQGTDNTSMVVVDVEEDKVNDTGDIALSTKEEEVIEEITPPEEIIQEVAPPSPPIEDFYLEELPRTGISNMWVIFPIVFTMSTVLVIINRQPKEKKEFYTSVFNETNV